MEPRSQSGRQTPLSPLTISFPSQLPPGNCGSWCFAHSVMSGSLRPHGPQHARLPCPSLSPRVPSNLCSFSWWCHPTNSPSVIPFSSCPQSFPASASFPMNWPFTSVSQSIGTSASASVFPMNIQDWFPLGSTGLISLQSKGRSRVFLNTTVQKYQFFITQNYWKNHSFD